jgi:hypothetical protein
VSRKVRGGGTDEPIGVGGDGEGARPRSFSYVGKREQSDKSAVGSREVRAGGRNEPTGAGGE